MEIEVLQKDKIKRVPKLRFGEFDREWLKTKVVDFAPLQRGFDLPVIEIKEGDYPVVFSNGILKTHSESKAKAPGVVTGRSGTLGKVTFVENEYWPHNTTLWVTDFKGNDPKYVYYFYLNFKLERFGTGSSVPTLNRNDIHVQKRCIPSLPEQQKIASFLSAVDKKIQQLIRKKDLLELYKKGVMQKLFSQEIRFKPALSGAEGDANAIDFPKWKNKKIGEVLKIGSGRDYKHLKAGEIPVYGTGGLMTFVNDFLFDGDSVGIGRKGTIDKPVFLKSKFWTVDTLFYTHSFNQVLPKFVFSIFQQINWKKHNEASGVPSLSKKTIEEIKIPVPCGKEQQKIADFLSGLDIKIEVVSQQITQTQNFKKGLLQQMFV